MSNVELPVLRSDSVVDTDGDYLLTLVFSQTKTSWTCKHACNLCQGHFECNHRFRNNASDTLVEVKTMMVNTVSIEPATVNNMITSLHSVALPLNARPQSC